MDTILQLIIQADEFVFHLINSNIQNSIFDWFLPLMRNKFFWIPFYVFLISFLLYNISLRKALIYILAILICMSISDLTSSTLIKNKVKRLRPCQQYEMKYHSRLLVHCGNGYSFTSSHATNHFALAFFLSMTLGQWFPRIKWPLYIWAGIISFSQIYVGVHFPLDILAGALLGSCIGILMARAFKYIYPEHFNK